MKIELDLTTFKRLVGTNNPYNKGIYYAFITWDGYDFSEEGNSEEDAKQNLWNKHFNL